MKALEILDLVADFGKPVRFKDVLERNPYPKATLYRFLQVLTNQNMLIYDSELGTYRLGGRLVRLAHVAWKSSSLSPLAKKYTELLAVKTGETVHLAQIDNGQVVFVDKVRANPRVETLAQVGMVAPASLHRSREGDACIHGAQAVGAGFPATVVFSATLQTRRNRSGA